jgi:hypothetical protein
MVIRKFLGWPLKNRSPSRISRDRLVLDVVFFQEWGFRLDNF